MLFRSSLAAAALGLDPGVGFLHVDTGESRRRHAPAIRAWKPSDKPEWLNEETYRREIQPKLAPVTVPAIRKALGISKVYATNIRTGKRLPHPRHWQRLAQLVGIFKE